MFKLHTYLQRYAQQQQIKLLRSVLKHTAWFKEFSYTLKTPTGGIAWKSSPPSHTVATGLVTQTLLLTKEARPWSQHALVVSYADTSRQQCGAGMTSSEPNINLSKAANNRPHYSFQPCFSTSSWTFSWFFFLIYSSTDPLGSSTFLQLLIFIRDLLLYFTALSWWGHTEFQHFIHETPSLTLPLLHTSESLLHLWKAQPETRLALLNMWIMKKMY